MTGLSILILDDEESLAEELKEYLTNLGHSCVARFHPEDALALIESEHFDILLLDLKLPEMDGLEVLRRVKRVQSDMEVIVMSGHGDIESVTHAFRLGAFDFLQKSFRPADIRIAIERTSTYQVLQRKYRELEARHQRMSKELEEQVGSAFIGEGEATRRVLDLVDRSAQSQSSTVLVSGESGTGKELVARMIHFRSSRKEAPLITVNCAAVQSELFESEFFGHVKGAFTGAVADRTGFVRRAHGGTLFLDEVGELPMTLQAKLLRVLEYGVFSPVGSDREETADVRIVAATNKDLRGAVATGAFRTDLYYRLQTIELVIPPLRQRPEDIEPLVSHFLHEFAERMGRTVPTISNLELDRLTKYSFPGNVRELKNLIERGMMLHPDDFRLPLPEPSAWYSPAAPSASTSEISARSGDPFDSYQGPLPTLVLSDLESRALHEALRRTGGVHSRAARLLGITRQALARRMEKHGISPSEYP
ncbi:MAG: sigma-54 dependent transcriptional regulator [Alkalispirochaeta sp.]